MKYKFPENFLFGTSASGPQTEGAAAMDGKSPTTWDYWHSIQPERFFDGLGPTRPATSTAVTRKTLP